MQPEGKQLVGSIRRRLNLLIYVSIIGLVITGILLSNRSPLFFGFFNLANDYSLFLAVKHILTILMVVFTIVQSQVLPRFTSLAPPTQKKLTAGLLFANIIMGVLMLLLSGILAAVSIMTSVP